MPDQRSDATHKHIISSFELLPMSKKMVIIKEVDKQGRMVLPKAWRRRHDLKRVVLNVEDDVIVVAPYKPADITKLFDSVEIDLKSDLKDWKSVKRELDEVR